MNNDIIHLQRDFQIFATSVIDTQCVFTHLYPNERIRLEDMATELNIDICDANPIAKFSDWRVRPLHKDQITYAITDAIVTLNAWYIMLPTFKEQLGEAKKKNILYPPLYESNKKTSSCYVFPHRYQAATLANKEKLTFSEELIFKKIYKWTWDKAVYLDHPPKRLIHEKDLAKLAKIQPTDVKSIRQAKINFHPLLDTVIQEIIPLLATPPPEETTTDYFEFDEITEKPTQEIPAPAPKQIQSVQKEVLCMNCFETDHVVSLPCPNPKNIEGKKKWLAEHPEYVKHQHERRGINKKKN
jgi:ribonuclease D